MYTHISTKRATAILVKQATLCDYKRVRYEPMALQKVNDNPMPSLRGACDTVQTNLML